MAEPAVAGRTIRAAATAVAAEAFAPGTTAAGLASSAAVAFHKAAPTNGRITALEPASRGAAVGWPAATAASGAARQRTPA